jgi:general secretion pathway protein G
LIDQADRSLRNRAMSKYADLGDDEWPPIVPSDRGRGLARRLLVSAAVGVAIAGTAYLCAWCTIGAAFGQGGHLAAQMFLRTIRKGVEAYKKEHGRYPEKLADLKTDLLDQLRPPDSGDILDPWGNPYQYTAERNSYTLLSFGADGKRGGEGLDQDYDVRALARNDQGIVPLPVPTLWQFTFDCGTGGIMVACALGGVFAFVACVVAWKPLRSGPIRSAISLSLTLTACLVTALFMSLLHIPNGH